MLTPVLFTLLTITGLIAMLYKKPVYKKKDLTVINTLTNVTSTITIEQDVEDQIRQAFNDCHLAVIDEQITER